MDETLFLWFNQWNNRFEILDSALRFADLPHIKSLPFMLVFCAVWFLYKNEAEWRPVREKLLAALSCTIPIIAVTRAVANYAPFKSRPIHTEGLELALQESQTIGRLTGFSSMPSDHASLFIGLAVAVLLIHRGFGAFLLAWAILIVAMPRIIQGWHWPSDILVGAAVGTFTVLLLMPFFTGLVHRLKVVTIFEARPEIGYPLLFFVMFEIVMLFRLSRYVLIAFLE